MQISTAKKKNTQRPLLFQKRFLPSQTEKRLMQTDDERDQTGYQTAAGNNLAYLTYLADDSQSVRNRLGVSIN
jgi:hypothetical protein